MRDQATEHFQMHTGSARRPRAGSVVSHCALAWATIAGGYECNDHQATWAALDRAHSKHSGVVLLRGGSSKGAQHFAACWADA